MQRPSGNPERERDGWNMPPHLFFSLTVALNPHVTPAAGESPLCPTPSSISAWPASLTPLSPLQLCRKHKVGILYCKAGQSSEEEMYNNEEAGPAFEEFLSLIGEKVCLKGFTKYAAQLDVKSKWPQWVAWREEP